MILKKMTISSGWLRSFLVGMAVAGMCFTPSGSAKSEITVASKKEKECVNLQDHTLEAKAFIQDLGEQGIRELTGKNLTAAQRRGNFERLFVEKFDYARIGKFVLGRYRKDAKARMDEYLKLFKDTIVRTYAARFGEYNNEKFRATQAEQGPKSYMVKSQILRPNNSKVLIEWHLYMDKEGNFKIFDVVVEGVSMALTQRSEYGAIITNKGGIDGLIEQLKKNPPKATFPTQS